MTRRGFLRACGLVPMAVVLTSELSHFDRTSELSQFRPARRGSRPPLPPGSYYVFDEDDIMAAISDEVLPLFGSTPIYVLDADGMRLLDG